MPSPVKKKLFGPDRFSHFGVYRSQTNRQAKLKYIDRSADLLLGLYFSLVYIFPLQSESSKGS